jgi:alpha-L-fucosidase
MGLPEKSLVVPPLALGGKLTVGKIQNVELLGYGGKLTWRQDEAGLSIQLPETKPCKFALAFRVRGAI